MMGHSPVANQATAPLVGITNNPYLDEFRQLYGKDHPDFLECFDLHRHSMRRDFTKKYAWAIPNEAALDAIAAYAPIIEIGAGGGYWAWLLQQRGVSVKPFDNRSTHQRDGGIVQWIPVEMGGPERTADFPDHALLLCWPPYLTSMAEDALSSYGGSTVIYIGEDSGCTATDGFEETLRKEWAEVASVLIPQWPGILDYMRIFQRKREIA